MKTTVQSSRPIVQLIAFALAISIAGPAFAQDNPNRKERREAREERREERAERREELVEQRREARVDTPREVRQEHRQDRREVKQERRQDRREVKQERRQERREDRREVRQERRQAQRYAQQYQQRLIEQQRRWVAYNHHARYNSARFSHRYRMGGRYWNTNRYGAEMIRDAANQGYAEGIRAGRADRYDNWRFDYRDSRAYRDGAYGYNGRYVSRDHYAHYFREGFRRGYEDGYYGRSRYGRHDKGQYFMIGAILSAILGLESI